MPIRVLYSSLVFGALTPRAAPTGSWHLLNATQLILGDGPVMKNGSVLYDPARGTIVYAGPGSDLPPVPANVTQLVVPVLMPGLWDTHTHFAGTSCSEIGDDMATFAEGMPPRRFEQFACALQMAREAICAGVTSVREVGNSFSQPLAHVLNSGLFPGPHFHYAGFPLGMTGGHTDEQYEPQGVVANSWGPFFNGGTTGVCDGVDECLKRAREQLRAQADVLKIMATGGVLSAFDQPTDQELSLEEVRAVTSEARRARRVVAAHAHGAPGIISAIEGGVRTIEHGSYGNDTIWRMALARGVLYTPTIAITQSFNGTRPPAYNKRQWAKGTQVLAHHSDSVRAALRVGVKMTTGTDCPFGSCAKAGSEIVYLNRLFGVQPIDAIRMATADAPMTLGDLGLAPKTGRLARGYAADMIALARSPLDAIESIADTDNILYVWKAGRLLKQPGGGVCQGVGDLQLGRADKRVVAPSAASIVSSF